MQQSRRRGALIINHETVGMGAGVSRIRYATEGWPTARCAEYVVGEELRPEVRVLSEDHTLRRGEEIQPGVELILIENTGTGDRKVIVRLVRVRGFGQKRQKVQRCWTQPIGGDDVTRELSTPAAIRIAGQRI